MKKKYLIFLIIIVVLIPFVLEYAIFRNPLYSAISNSDWSGFLGGYVGGVATLFAVYITTKETRKIQKQNNDYILLENKKKFADGIAEDISVYITDISKYFSDNKHEHQLYEDKNIYEQTLKEKRESIHKYDVQNNYDEDVADGQNIKEEISKLEIECSNIMKQIQDIENQMLNNKPNRVIAINKLFLLKIKLRNIDSANKLLQKLEYVHQISTDYNMMFTEFSNNTDELLELTMKFIEKYVM